MLARKGERVLLLLVQLQAMAMSCWTHLGSFEQFMLDERCLDERCLGRQTT